MSTRLALLAALALVAGAAPAQDTPLEPPATPAPEATSTAGAPAEAAPAAPDTSGWSCRFCTFEDGWSLWAEPGIATISDDSYRFGDFTGLEEQGIEPVVAAGWRWREAESGRSLDVQARRRGSDSGDLSATGGQQGRYRAWFEYQGIPHYVAADGVSPFRGGTAQVLPGGWATGGSTGGMAALNASLRAVSLDQARQRSALGVAFQPHALIDARAEYRRDAIHGSTLTGASFLTQASQLARPLDQTHERIDLAVGLRHAKVHAEAALESSFFANDARAQSWQNPYNAPAPGATTGRMAQAPDNSAHRLSLTAGTVPGTPVQLSGQLTLGRLRQDDRFLPATTNPDEAVALPRPSLDAAVDTLLVAARASYSFGPALRLTADVLRDDRDNRTPVDAYTQVVMDTFTGATRSNAPYGFTRNRWRFSAERRSAPRLAVGIDDDRRERRLYGTGETTERRYWGRTGWRPFAGADLRLRVAYAEREGTEYAADPAVAAQNPRLRAYNTAERQREEARADFSLGGGTLTQSFHLSYASDEYPDTVLGRRAYDEVGYGADTVMQLAESLSLSAFASHREQETGQAGSQAFGAPDWLAEQEDASNVLGASLAWQARRGLDFGADYVYSTSAGSITMLAAASDRAFPLLLTRWHDGRLYGRYAVRPDLTLRLDLLYERYTARDWGQQGLDPDTVPNLLALGQGTQSGSVTALLLGARYEFGGAAPAAD